MRTCLRSSRRSRIRGAKRLNRRLLMCCKRSHSQTRRSTGEMIHLFRQSGMRNCGVRRSSRTPEAFDLVAPGVLLGVRCVAAALEVRTVVSGSITGIDSMSEPRSRSDRVKLGEDSACDHWDLLQFMMSQVVTYPAQPRSRSDRSNLEKTQHAMIGNRCNSGGMSQVVTYPGHRSW